MGDTGATTALLRRELSVTREIARIFTLPDDRMYGEMLDVILRALDSHIGIFGYVDEDGALVCPSMTRDVWEQCQMEGKAIVFPRETWGGIWGEAVLARETRVGNRHFEVPEGHVPVTRALDVPLVHNDVLIGNLLVGNKPTDYDDDDARLLEAIAAQISPVLDARLERDRQDRRRRSAEEDLREANEFLERRVAERTEALLRSEANYREIFDLATDMIVVQDLQTGAVIDINDETARQTGYTREEYLAHGIEVTSPEGPEYAPERAIARVMAAAAGEPQLFEWGFVHKDGTFHPTEVHLKRVTLAGEERLLGVVRDISERRAVEREREQLDRKMQQAQKLESLGCWPAASPTTSTTC